MSESWSRPFSKAEIAAMRRQARAEDTPLSGFWPALRRVLRNLPFAEDLVASYLCAIDPATPARVRMVLAGALAYFILPIDALPDFLPLVGFTDDVAVLAAAIASVRGALTERHYAEARRILSEEARR